MTITSRSSKGIMVLTLSGRLDFQARHAFQSSMKEAESLTSQHIVLDMERVTFINSAGVVLIKQLIQQSKIAGVAFTLANPQGQVYGVLTLCKIDELAPIVVTFPAS